MKTPHKDSRAGELLRTALRLTTLLLTLFPPVVSAAQLPTRKIRFQEATCRMLLDRPLIFSIPRDFITRAGKSGDLIAGCYWGTRDQLNLAVKQDGYPDLAQIRQGIFRNGISMGVGFDEGHFMDGPGGSLETIKSSMKANGIQVTAVHEGHAGPFPTLELRGNFAAGLPHAGSSKVYLLYIALGVDTNVLYVNYLAPEKASSTDDDVWQTFVDGIRPTPEVNGAVQRP